MTQANRKRGRSMEEETSEFTPLSKRINNLHINGLTGLKDSSGDQNKDSKWINGNYTPSPNHSEPSQSSSSCDGYSSNQVNFGNEYRPDLDATENPHYYENNRLLYTLYMERIHRRNFNNL